MHVLITGSTRGIGFGLAKYFLEAGWKVSINGRSEVSVDNALQKLVKDYPASSVQGFAGDVVKIEAVEKLWENAVQGFGAINIWINNAGVGQDRENVWEIDYPALQKVIEINLTGVVNGSLIAVRNMLKQGHGQVFNMEGYGSNGMMMKQMTIYGMTKRAITYFSQSLALEVADTPLKVGLLSPGMVLTDLLENSIPENQEEASKAQRIYRILGDPVDPVVSFLVAKIIANRKNGTQIKWLTRRKTIFKFIKSLFSKQSR